MCMVLPTILNTGACGGTPEELTANSGTIQSPGYTSNEYPDNANCQWRITAPSGTVRAIVNITLKQYKTTCSSQVLSDFSFGD